MKYRHSFQARVKFCPLMCSSNPTEAGGSCVDAGSAGFGPKCLNKMFYKYTWGKNNLWSIKYLLMELFYLFSYMHDPALWNHI